MRRDDGDGDVRRGEVRVLLKNTLLVALCELCVAPVVAAEITT